jgi:hypothetical protein
MSLVGVFPMLPVSVYMRPAGAERSRSVNTTTEPADDNIIGLILLVTRVAVRL